jgi:DNA primase
MGGLIPQPFIDEVLTKTDIVTLIDSYVPLKKQGTSHAACCPFHDEKTPSFNVIPKKQFYHCFGCGASGNVISFVMNHLHQDFPEAIETLAARVGLEVPHDGKTTQNHKTSLPLYELLDNVARFYQQQLTKPSGHAATNYLEAREVTGDVLTRYHIGYAPPGWHTLETAFKAHRDGLITTGMLVQKDDNSTYDRYRDRVIFPIHDRHGRLIGFGGRVIDSDQKPKYLNSPETVIFQKNRELYGLHQVLEAHTSSLEHILVVEGYMDVIALAQHGISNAVATLGTATSTYHIQLLSKHTDTIIFCFDGDEAGKKAALRALDNTLPALDGTLNAQFIFLAEGDDPDSLVRREGKSAFTQCLKHATPLHQYLIQILTHDLDMTHLVGRSKLLKAITPYWKKIPEGPYKHLLTDELAHLAHLDMHRVEGILNGKPAEHIQPKNPSNMKRTPVRLATALLLQYPELYTQTHKQLPPLEQLNEPGQQVLCQLIERLKDVPTSSTASLIETFRHTSMFDALNKLAAWDSHIPEETLAAEFTETVHFLTKQNATREVEHLIEKARGQSLSSSEQQKLQSLLQSRHRPIEKQ